MTTIRINTPIPGPKSKALSARRAQAVPRGLSHGTPIYVAKAEDAWLEDVDGNRYIDFAGGIGCANAGHRQEAVVEAIRGQLDKYPPHLRPGHALRRLHPPRRAHERSHAGKVSQENSFRQQRRRSGRERSQDRPRLHQASRDHRLRRRLPRPHHDDSCSHQQDASL